MKKNNFTLSDWLILIVILIIALAFRLYKIDSPLADFHSWRQADTAAVARNFIKAGFNLLHPQYDDLSSIQSGKDNPEGLRLVEFPLYNASFAALNKYLPIFSLEIYGRLVSTFASLVVIGIIYYLLVKEASRLSAVIAGLTYATFPFFVFFSRVILPESSALACAFLAIFFLYIYQQKNNFWQVIYYFLALIFFSTALLIKPTTIFYALVLFYLFARKNKAKVFTHWTMYLFFILTLLPLLLWRKYIQSYPQAIPASEWLLFSVNTPQGLQKIFFRPSFLRWIFFERINNLIFGGFASGFFLLGIVRKNKSWLFPVILIAALAYLLTFQGGNLQHAYYQTLIFPALAIFTGLGVDLLFAQPKIFINPFLSTVLVIAVLATSWFFSYYQVRDYYQYSPDLLKIAKIIKTLTLPEDKIVTDTLGDTTLLYLSERKGYPAPIENFDRLKDKGLKYFVTMQTEVIQSLKKTNQYPLIFENDKFAIFEL
jgi:hypothetical protein